MRFKTDENLSESVAAMLRAEGHDAMSIYEQAMSGSPDARVSAVVKEERRALITLDLDFSNIHAYPPADHCGIIVLRPARQDNASVLALLKKIRLFGRKSG